MKIVAETPPAADVAVDREAAGAPAPLQHARRLERSLRDAGVVTAPDVSPLVAYQLLDFET